jgi:beta-lactamase regulating signal transducer with metallopeptidase domain
LLNTIFYSILNMSITAAIIGCILLIFRFIIGRRLPRLIAYSLWSLVLFRMLIPFSPGSKISLLNIIEGHLTRTITISNPGEQLPQMSMLNSVRAATEYFPIEFRTTALQGLFTTAGIVWLFGAFSVATVSIILYVLISLQLNRSILLKDDTILKRCKDTLGVKNNVRLFTNNTVASPIVFGFIKPRIIIPANTDKTNLEYILLHELVHIKRRDNLWRVIGILAVCLHWFNPFVWLFLYVSAEDMELACDSKVLGLLDYAQRKEYSRALAVLAVKQHTALTAFGGRAVKQRIINALSYKHISVLMTIISAVFCIILIFMLITNPV